MRNRSQVTWKNLPEGTYDVSVPELGLTTNRFVQQNVSVQAGKTTALDIALQKGNLGIVGDDNAYVALRNKYTNVRGPAPRTPDGRPDLSGVWNGNIDRRPALIARCLGVRRPCRTTAAEVSSLEAPPPSCHRMSP